MIIKDYTYLETAYSHENFAVLFDILKQEGHASIDTTELLIQVNIQEPIPEIDLEFGDITHPGRLILVGEHKLYKNDGKIHFKVGQIDWNALRIKTDIYNNDFLLKLLDDNLDNMPLYINSTEPITKIVLKWRLTIGR